MQEPEAAEEDAGLKEIEIITKPTYKLIGRLFVDHLISDQDDLHEVTFGDAENRTRFDTARIGIEGNVYENVEYKIEMAFGEAGVKANGTQNVDRPVFKDVYISYSELAYVGTIRVGHFKEPFSLEELTSARFITFMERSLMNAFVPARNIGLMAYNHVYDDESLSWYTGIFRPESDDDPPDVSEDRADYAWTSRIAWNPFYDEPTEGRYLVHLGAGFSYREYGDDTVSYSKDHELNLIYPVGNPIRATFAVEDLQLYNFEAAWVNGPLHVTGEYTWVNLNAPDGALDGEFDGAFVQVGYFLTGEHRGYKKSSHSFDRVKVYEPFFCVTTADGCCKGHGAWEIAARWSYVDLTDAGIEGGHAQNVTVGVNWYLNSYARVMFDYIHGDSEDAPVTGLDGGETDLLGMRAQVDW
jgi:phosphate-selective porin OprO/OprP